MLGTYGKGFMVSPQPDSPLFAPWPDVSIRVLGHAACGTLTHTH